nr:MAG: hypothetical protein EDM05_13470 [Leptolyngbya sp. IPPAS B-1204]
MMFQPFSQLFILGLASIIGLSVAAPVQAQFDPTQTDAAPASPLASDPAELDSGVETLPPDLTVPLEVDQQQADQFFAPQNSQIIQPQPAPGVLSDELIGPPPGSQTPAELTPNQQLTIPIR